MSRPNLSAVPSQPATPPTPTIKRKFGDTPLKDSELPNFLARAAAKAYRKNMLADPAKPDLKGSPGFTGTKGQRQQIEKAAALGLTLHEMSRVFMIEPDLLKFYFGYEIGTAKIRTNMSVAKVALEMALSGNDSDMTRFWLTHQANWKATTVVEHNGIDAAADEARAAREKLIGSGKVFENAAGGAEVEDSSPQ